MANFLTKMELFHDVSKLNAPQNFIGHILNSLLPKIQRKGVREFWYGDLLKYLVIIRWPKAQSPLQITPVQPTYTALDILWDSGIREPSQSFYDHFPSEFSILPPPLDKENPKYVALSGPKKISKSSSPKPPIYLNITIIHCRFDYTISWKAQK